ncbi:MAG TPA: capsule biosynthesis protein [Rhodobacteraceae bacterium]|nr:capsule biosynthesis protein [Paracoccaceae bacterium]
MTTKPKAKKYRIRRSEPLSGGAAKHTEKAKTGEVSDAREVSVEESIEAIRKEGLTGRQLRMARRVAQKYGLQPVSDFDAVRLLREKGVDPFQRSDALVLKGENQGSGRMDPQLPQTVPLAQSNLPSTEVDTAAARAKEILAIQRDIARRRRRKLALLFTRLAFFVLLPTMIVGYYQYFIATPMYATKSEFVIQKASSQSTGGLGGLFGGTSFATAQDSVAVQGYLQSRDAMMRLDADHGFKEHFSQETIDPIQRLDKDASNEEFYRLYKKMVKISYDPTEGIIKMEVIAADPEVSTIYSKALISYAEEQVDHMTARLRADQMKGARKSYEDAEKAMLEAQEKVINLQETMNLISGEVEVTLLTSQISALQQELLQSELSLEEMKSNPRPNPAKVEPLERKIKSLQNKIETLRAQLTANSADEDSIARKSSELKVAQANLATRNLMLQAALEQLETARIEANRQTRYLSLGVSPVPPDEPTYPRKFENTILALLIFSGIYLMVSLTVSILREQVSS